MTKEIRLIIGLGNPDRQYLNTYHNVGFLFMEFMKSSPLMASGYTLVASNVYMNLSGGFVAKEIKKRGVKPEELLVVHDDSDLELGKYKLSFGRGAAGHHGAESVIKSLGTKSFWRLRIGVRPDGLADSRRLDADQRGNKKSCRTRASEFVLKKITSTNKKILESVFQEILRTTSLSTPTPSASGGVVWGSIGLDG